MIEFNYIDKWITFDEYKENYSNVTLSTLYTKYKKSKPHYMKKKSGTWYINIGYLIAFKKEKVRLWNIAHEYYYAIVEGFAENKLAKMIAKFLGENYQSWLVFLNNTMWQRVDIEEYHNPTISDYLVKFIKFVESMVSKWCIYKKVGLV